MPYCREVGEDIVIKIALDFDGSSPLERLEVQLGYARNAGLKMSVYASSKGVLDAGALQPRKSKYRPQAIRDELRKAQPLAVLVPAFYGVTLGEEYRAGAVVNQLLEGGEQSRIVRNLVTRLKPTAFAGLSCSSTCATSSRPICKTASMAAFQRYLKDRVDAGFCVKDPVEYGKCASNGGTLLKSRAFTCESWVEACHRARPRSLSRGIAKRRPIRRPPLPTRSPRPTARRDPR